MIGFKEIPVEPNETVAAIQNFHGYEESLPSIYCCTAQWPGFLGTDWDDLSPVLEDNAFKELHDDAYGLVEDYARTIPYHPQISPDQMKRIEFAEDEIGGTKDLFTEFNRGAIAAQTVVPFLNILASMVDAEGPRELP